MPKGTLPRCVLLFSLIFCRSPAFGDGAPPTSAPSEPPLPAGAIRRLGDLRLADTTAHGAFLSADAKRLISFGTDLVTWDLSTGWQISRYRVADHLLSQAARFGDGRVAVVCNSMTADALSHLLVLNESARTLDREIDPSWKGAISHFAAAADGSRFAVEADHLLLCDGTTGKPVRDLGEIVKRNNQPHIPRGIPFDFSADSKTFYYMDPDARAHLLDAQTGADLSDRTYLAAHGTALRGDGKMLATIAEDRQLHLIDTTSGDDTAVDPLEIQFAPERPAVRLTLLNVGFVGATNVLWISYNTPGLYTLDTSVHPLPKPKRIGPAGITSRVPLFSSDGAVMAVIGPSSRWGVYDTQTSKQLSPDSFGMGRVTALAVAPMGRECIFGTMDDQLFRWDLESGKLLKQCKSDTTAMGDKSIHTLAYVDGGKSLFERASTQTRFCDPVTLATTRLNQDMPQGMYGGYGGVLFSPDGRWRAEMHNQDLVLVDAKTSTEKMLQHSVQPGAADILHPGQISPDGSLLHAWTSYGPRFMDLKTLQLGPVLALGRSTMVGYQTVQFSPDSRWVVIQLGRTIALCDSRSLLDPPAPGTENLSPTYYDQNRQPVPVKQLNPVWKLDASGIFENDASFSSSGELVVLSAPVSLNTIGGASVIETRTGRTVLNLPPSYAKIIAARFVPAHHTLISVDQAGTALLWDLAKLLPPVDAKRSDEQLWADLAGPDSAIAYTSGAELLRRQVLVNFARKLTPVHSQNTHSDTDRAQELIDQLSSTVSAEREKSAQSPRRNGRSRHRSCSHSARKAPGWRTGRSTGRHRPRDRGR